MTLYLGTRGSDFTLVAPPKLNIETWKWWFPTGISFSRGWFSGSMLKFRGVDFGPMMGSTSPHRKFGKMIVQLIKFYWCESYSWGGLLFSGTHTPKTKDFAQLQFPPIIMVQWKMGPSNTSCLSFSMVFHFHVYGRERNVPKQKFGFKNTSEKKIKGTRISIVSSSSASLSFPSWIGKAKRRSEKKNLTQPKDHERLNFIFSY